MERFEALVGELTAAMARKQAAGGKGRRLRMQAQLYRRIGGLLIAWTDPARVNRRRVALAEG
ncbi:hypothetical protein P9314_23495 [Paenibacillus validus]|uniref:Uncharacterized protein n=1 Tax=Paenibacillus validus TaxID=44253 RepID=A0A7X2ZFA9_9BACL|nr:hypothetical protein [Paenibacillus validus]MED4603596.1 hypothetical protein [Paenibacillus validus]MED4607980.1 hypothetical protein [Paenibacillus validus]MUG73821.1 hypothetical protein [Paenibacillus validus]